MKIKEVSMKTGLSDKTIRYYESEGLIEVQREKNAYRTYSDETIEKLNLIRLLRYLSLSIDEIKVILNDPESWRNYSSKLENKFSSDQKEMNRKKVLFEILKYESMDSLKEDASNLMKEIDDGAIFNLIDDFNTKSFFATIIQSLIISGPFFWLLLVTYYSSFNDYINMKLLVPFVICSIIGNTLLWRNYFKNKSKNKKHSNTFISFIILIFTLILVLGIFVLFNLLQIQIYSSKNSYGIANNWIILQYISLIVLVLQVVTFAFGIRGKKTNDSDFELHKKMYQFASKHIFKLIIMNIILVYINFTSITVINKDGSLIRITPINPLGTIYNTSEIIKVHVGYNSGLLKHYKQDFSMFLFTSDFKVDIAGLIPIVELEDTYYELEVLDKLYVKHGIPKVITNDNRKYCSYDKVFCDRFDRIINNLINPLT